MKYAVDQGQKKLIHAKEAKHYKSYACPVCKKPVYARALSKYSIQAPHFAHQRNVGTVDCELFHPSSAGDYNLKSMIFQQDSSNGASPLINPQALEPLERDRPEKKHFAIQKFVFCKQTGKTWGLFLSLNIPPTFSRWTGEIVLDSRSSQVRFRSSTISCHTSFEVSRDFSTEFFHRAGDVDEVLWQGLIEDLPDLTTREKLVFRDSLLNSRLIEDSESLYLGNSYLVLQKSSVVSVLIEPLSQRLAEIDQCFLYRISLPTNVEDNELKAIQKFFGMQVRSAKPVVSVLDPLPLTIMADGTVGVSLNTEKVIFKVSGHLSDYNLVSINGVSSLDQTTFANDLILADVTHSKGCSLYWRGEILISVEKMGVEDISPLTINMRSEGLTFEVREADRFVELCYEREIAIESPFPLRTLLKAKKFGLPAAISSDNKLCFDAGTELDFGPFGYLAFFPEESASDSPLNSTEHTDLSVQQLWIRNSRFDSRGDWCNHNVSNFNRASFKELDFFTSVISKLSGR